MDSEKEVIDKKPDEKPKAEAFDQKDIDASEIAAVKDWNKKISKARAVYNESAFNRMRNNMAFITGRQWPGQNTIEFDKYVSNITLKVIMGMVAQLYAKNPKFTAERRRRMDFQVWDGQMESLQAAQAAMTMPFMPTSPEELQMQMKARMQAQVLMNDFQQGEQWRKLVSKIGETMELIFEWNIKDNCKPDFKEQCKQMVFRALVTCVGYIEVGYSRELSGGIMTSETESSMLDRAKQAKFILEKLEKGDIEKGSKQMETYMELVQSLMQSSQNNDANNINERLHFNFIQSTAIIPDENCTQLRGFVNADYVCHEEWLPLDQINAYFETQINANQVNQKGDSDKERLADNKGEPKPAKVCLRHVWRKSTRNHFYIIDGYDKWVSSPVPLEPESDRFWPVHALTFIPVESNMEGDKKVSIFPPSHVDLLRPAQEEWNRCRETLREHRKANQPKYVANAQYFPNQEGGTNGDLAKLCSAEPNEIIEARGMSPETNINNAIVALKHDAIDPMLHDTSQSLQDILMTSSNQEANLGPPGKRVTATGEVISEQSKNSLLSSYVDNLDEFLSGIAQQCGEYLLRELTIESAQRIAGRGAVWPTLPKDRELFVQELYLDVRAASSGRPNAALNIANMEKITPLLMATGANPKGILRYIIHQADADFDESEFYPLVPPQAASPPGGTPKPMPQAGPNGNNPQQSLHNGSPPLGAM